MSHTQRLRVLIPRKALRIHAELMKDVKSRNLRVCNEIADPINRKEIEPSAADYQGNDQYTCTVDNDTSKPHSQLGGATPKGAGNSSASNHVRGVRDLALLEHNKPLRDARPSQTENTTDTVELDLAHLVEHIEDMDCIAGLEAIGTIRTCFRHYL